MNFIIPKDGIEVWYNDSEYPVSRARVDCKLPSRRCFFCWLKAEMDLQSLEIDRWVDEGGGGGS